MLYSGSHPGPGAYKIPGSGLGGQATRSTGRTVGTTYHHLLFPRLVLTNRNI